MVFVLQLQFNKTRQSKTNEETETARKNPVTERETEKIHILEYYVQQCGRRKPKFVCVLCVQRFVNVIIFVLLLRVI